MASNSSLILRRLYRSLLKSAKPFTPPSPNAVAFTCLLHRTGVEDGGWFKWLRENQSNDDDLNSFDEEENRVVFRNLLREVVAGDSGGYRQMQFPRHAQKHPSRLRDIIRREFRGESGALSSSCDVATRRELAFMALRELNTKLAWAEGLLNASPEPHPGQAAKGVSPLPLDPAAYLKPGAYLVAHPNLTGEFRRTVICILKHREEGDEDDEDEFSGTYGLVCNRTRVNGRNSLEEVLPRLPDRLKYVFGEGKHGGPVYVSLQMLHAATADLQEELKIGGTPLPMIPKDDSESTAICSDRAVYYGGDLDHAIKGVLSGRLDREDVSLFVGASCWETGQLESEIERGTWLPCRGPPEIAQSGICDHDACEDGHPRPEADLWLSMMSSLGQEEARLAHLVFCDDGKDECSRPADAFTR